MFNPDSKYPALAADAATNPESARIMTLLKRVDAALAACNSPTSLRKQIMSCKFDND